MNCPVCGAPVMDGSAICPTCGAQLSAQAAPQGMQPQMGTPVQPQAPQGMPIQPQMAPQGMPMGQPMGMAPQAAPAAPAKKFPVIPVVAGVAVLAIIAVVLVIVLGKGGGKSKSKVTTCEMCSEEKSCYEYEITMDGETESGWLCDDCADTMEGLISLAKAMDPSTDAKMKKK